MYSTAMINWANVEQLYLSHKENLIWCYHSELEWTWEQCQRKGTPHSPELQEWRLTIRFGSVPYPGHLLVEESYTSTEMQSVYSTAPYIYIYIYIMIIMCHQHGYPWLSLATLPYRPLLPADPQGCFPYWHRVVVYRLQLVVQPLLVHVKGPTGVHHSWVRPYFSSNVPHV